MSNALMLTKRGTTSWGLPWCMTFGRAVILTDKDNEIKMLFIIDKEPDTDYVRIETIDPGFTLMDSQLEEMLCIARGMKKWCNKIKEWAKAEAVKVALTCLVACKDRLDKSTSEFFKSNAYKNTVAASMRAVRKGLNATFKSDDYVFSWWVEEDTNEFGCGAIYEEITKFIRYMAKEISSENLKEV